METWKQNLKYLTSREYRLLREMCHLSKNVYNTALYNVRKKYQEDGIYLTYNANYDVMKQDVNYIRLGSNISQQTMRDVDFAVKSFFALRKMAKAGRYESYKIKMPRYLDKDEFYPITFSHIRDSKTNETGIFTVPMSRELGEKYGKGKCSKIQIRIPPQLKDTCIKQIQIVPRCKGRFFEARYMFEKTSMQSVESTSYDMSKALSIDLGVTNFATCVTSEGESFIVDGRRLKSINQFYNREIARLSAIKDHQQIKCYTKKQYLVTQKKNRRIDDYIYKSAKYIISYCKNHQIGNIIVGYSSNFQQAMNGIGNSGTSRRNRQVFVQIPFGRFRSRLEYLCKEARINFRMQEESYTSKASFFDNDEIPVYGKGQLGEYHFSGKRVHRGLYQTKDGKVINADVNGALNILKKSNVVDLSVLYSRGEVLTPMRIRNF